MGSRATWEPAKGGKTEKSLGSLSKQYSSRDLPSHLKIKYRQSGQNNPDELKSKDFKRIFQDKERAAFEEKESKRSSTSSNSTRAITSSSSAAKKQKIEAPPTNLDADDKVIINEDGDEDDVEDEDDEDDDVAALMEELNAIKRERAVEEEKKERKKEQERVENILRGNPLLNTKADFSVKRRWDDDVVFKNCARDELKKPQFINDSLRSEFHKKFMEKYIK